METYYIYDATDKYYDNGFTVTIESGKDARKAALKKAKDSGAARMYGIKKPVAFNQAEFDNMLASR